MGFMGFIRYIVLFDIWLRPFDTLIRLIRRCIDFIGYIGCIDFVRYIGCMR